MRTPLTLIPWVILLTFAPALLLTPVRLPGDSVQEVGRSYTPRTGKASIC